jgi:hypothetical protein
MLTEIFLRSHPFLLFVFYFITINQVNIIEFGQIHSIKEFSVHSYIFNGYLVPILLLYHRAQGNMDLVQENCKFSLPSQISCTDTEDI